MRMRPILPGGAESNLSGEIPRAAPQRRGI